MSNSTLKSDAKLLNSTIIVSSMTLISRIFGMLRDVVFARYFGVSMIMDAFIVANRIPNMLRRFFGEGAFNQGFVPVISSYKENKNHKEVKVLVDSVAGTLGLILFIVSLIGVIFSPIFQVGCFSASSTVTFFNCSGAVFKNGPPEAVRIIFFRLFGFCGFE